MTKTLSYNLPIFSDLRVHPVAAGFVNVWKAAPFHEWTHIMGSRFRTRFDAEEFCLGRGRPLYRIRIIPHDPRRPI